MKSIVLISLMISVSTLTACKQLKQFSGKAEKSVICLKSQVEDNERFYATGSAPTLEQAKLNARQDLVQQISSNLSSTIEQKKTLDKNSVDQQSSSWAKSESENIPLDQHQVLQSCKSGNTFFAAVALNKQALLKSVQLRLQQLHEQFHPELSALKNRSRYQQYIKKQQLSTAHRQLQTYIKLLTIYQPDLLRLQHKQFAKQLNQFINKTGTLLIGIPENNRDLPTTTIIEQALNKAQLNYKHGTQNTVAIISVNANNRNQRIGNRHIIKLQASLDVSRADTGKLLKRHQLGKIVTTSTVSDQLALDNAYQKLSSRLYQHLNVSPASIRKLLGFEE